MKPALPLMAALFACACGQGGPSYRKPAAGDINANGFVAALPLSSPLDCYEKADLDDATRCEASDGTLIACAHGGGVNSGAASEVFTLSDEWRTGRGPLQEGLRCEPGRSLAAIGRPADARAAVRVSVVVPIAAARWMAVLTLLRSGDLRAGDSGRSKGLSLTFRDDFETYREDAQVERAKLKRGAAQCVSAFRTYRDRAERDDRTDFEGNASSETGVRREFAFRVVRRAEVYQLELKAVSEFEGGPRDGELIDVALRCSAPELAALTSPTGFDFAFVPSPDGREWIVEARRAEVP